MMQENYQHWQLTIDADHLLNLLLNRQDSSNNSLNEAVLTELDAILDAIALHKDLRGIIISSAKTNFIVGADVQEFTLVNDYQSALTAVQKGHTIFDKLEKLPIPTVAMIEGYCLGGGLELALACTYRVASNEGETRLGFPEVKLGIHPGWGGSVRLTRLIGALSAFELMFTGRQISSNAAKAMGIIDETVPKRQLLRAARHFILKQPAKAQANWWRKLSNHHLLRPFIAKFLQKQLNKKVKQDLYPAPYNLLDNWLTYGVSARAFDGEAHSVARLIISDTAKNLVRLFLLQDALKQQAKQSDFSAQHVHVIGAGVMGGDIAAWCCLQGLSVSLQDTSPAFIAKALKRAHALFSKRLKSPLKIRAALDRLQPDVQGYGVAKADVIIEAIYENLAAKQALFKDLEARMLPHAILATNTSSIPLAEIAQVLKDPTQLVGIHFFNPVEKMLLVEVVHDESTHQDKLAAALAFVNQIGRTPLAVKSSPGFLVNRVLMPYLMEAFQLLTEGYTPAAIDKAAEKFGMPMGPIELADTVGLDICLSVATHLSGYFSLSVPAKLKSMVEEGLLGRKTGQGFYTYQQGRPLRPTTISTELTPQLTDRLILSLLNEAAACLREGIVADSDSLDLGMVFGTGFVPSSGGPMHYAQAQGYATIHAKLEHLQLQNGDRFKPDAFWTQAIPEDVGRV